MVKHPPTRGRPGEPTVTKTTIVKVLDGVTYFSCGCQHWRSRLPPSEGGGYAYVTKPCTPKRDCEVSVYTDWATKQQGKAIRFVA